jgi:hypothetical protein
MGYLSLSLVAMPHVRRVDPGTRYLGVGNCEKVFLRGQLPSISESEADDIPLQVHRR